jgi:hypothetical protein
MKKVKKEKQYPYERATNKQLKVGAWWWCVHHLTHLEVLVHSVSDRVDYIQRYKPSWEVETRLRNLAPVLHPENLPARFLKAHRRHQKADQLATKTFIVYSGARDLLTRTPSHWKNYKKRVEAARKLKILSRKADNACAQVYSSYQELFKEKEKAFVKQHDREYPDNTWNGKNIFEKTWKVDR